jgi:CheY-like chemotaxis protein
MNDYILVVEDDPAVRDAVSVCLKEFVGHAVTHARDGNAALAQLRRDPNACVIVLDLMMPVMSGFELVDQLQADPLLKNIPVVVFTGMTPPFGQDLGAYAVLRKPVSAKQLSEVVSRFCADLHRPPPGLDPSLH